MQIRWDLCDSLYIFFLILFLQELEVNKSKAAIYCATRVSILYKIICYGIYKNQECIILRTPYFRSTIYEYMQIFLELLHYCSISWGNLYFYFFIEKKRNPTKTLCAVLFFLQ